MKTLTFEPRAPLIVGRVTLALSLGLLLAWHTAAHAQSAPDSPPQDAAPQVAGDPLGRSTPYGTVTGFLQAARLNDYERAAEYLDTRQTGDAAEALAEQLQTVMDSGLQGDLDALSRSRQGDLADGIRSSRDRIGLVATTSGQIEILVERIERAGQPPIWLFASETLAQIPSAAEEVTPLINPSRYLPSSLVDRTFLTLPLYHWGALLLLIPIALALGSLVTRALIPLLRPALRRVTGEEDDTVLTSLSAPIRLVLFGIAIRLFSALSATLLVRLFWTQVATTVVIIGVAWLTLRFGSVVVGLLEKRLRRRQTVGKVALLALAGHLFKVLVVIVTALLLLNRAGTDLTALLTGLGIGGLGLALAAQKTLENLIGGLAIALDEPIRVGDFCQFGDQMGTVEEIGVRSTRVRTLSRTVVAVPNGQLAAMNIENFSLRDKFWFHHTVGVRYETSPDQLRYLLAEIRRLLYTHPKVERDGARIRFVGFGASSLDLEIFAYVSAVQSPDFLAIQEDLLLRIMDIISESGTGVAFPSQTTYLARDTPLDPQKAKAAEAQVGAWRERGTLPFPDFHPGEVGHQQGRVQYPPAGSSLLGDAAGDGPGKPPR